MKIYFFIIFIFINQFVQAQLCYGSLGDPVVNITFGNQSNALVPLKAGLTNLQYLKAGCPNDGYYTITSSSYNCFSSSWFDISQDHTGDNEGRFMLINASYTPNDFYIDTVKGLCGNTTYEFGAWVANVIKRSNGGGSKPNLTFKIETIAGVVLGNYNTGAISEDNSLSWKQYGFFFKPDISTSSIVLRITNNAPGGMGNDLAIDDITFKPCGPKITGTISGGSDEITTCIDQQNIYNFNTIIETGFIDPIFQWQLSLDTGKSWSNITGANTTTFTRFPSLNSGVFLYRLLVGENANSLNNNCKVASNIISIKVLEIPHRTNWLDIKGCSGSSVKLTSTNNINLMYSWSGPNNFIANISNPVLNNLTYADSGIYEVKIANSIGCTAFEQVYLNIVEGVSAKINPSYSVICENETVNLKATGGDYYKWKPSVGINNDALSDVVVNPISDTADFSVIVKNKEGCFDSAFAKVIRIINPTVDAGNDQTILQGNSVRLSGKISGLYANYFWSPITGIINPHDLNTTVLPNKTTTYFLTARGVNNCPSVTDSLVITILLNVEIPNAFSPNGDGINDIWNITGLNTYPNSSLMLFNRYGQLLFHQKPYVHGWDGTYQSTPLPVGSYYYLIERGGGFPALNGTVIIIR
jgi:gliding motility-associated-like protein